MDFAIDSGAGVSSAGNVILLRDFATFPTLPPRYRRPEVVDAVAWSLESPLVAHRAYHRLGAISAESAHVMAFEGARRLVTSSDFSEISWPNDDLSVVARDTWRDRRFLAIINSNKGVGGWREFSARELLPSVRRIASAAIQRSYGVRGKWHVPDLYAERVRLLNHFAGDPGFDLYGVGWDRSIPGLGRREAERVRAAWRGAVVDKTSTLAGHKYALVVENTEYPGYVTEKIFDCFAAGTIPVYRGAPDIERLIPSETFVDARKYATPAELAAALRAQTAEQAAAQLGAARVFLSSPQFQRFTSTHLVDQLMASIEAARRRPPGHGTPPDRRRPSPTD